MPNLGCVLPKAGSSKADCVTSFVEFVVSTPREHPLPAVRQAIGYLFRNRRRMDYIRFRHWTAHRQRHRESACKTVVQARMKQAGMRWSRTGAQSMLALRCLLLSDRWQEFPSTG